MSRSIIKPRIRARARSLRKSRTLGEKEVQDYLRALRPFGAHFRRETPIGSYAVDFAWLSARIVVEVDGASHQLPGRAEHDRRKDAFLAERGFQVIRVRDADAIGNVSSAFEAIEAAVRPYLRDPSPSRFAATPSPQGGGGTRRHRRANP
jgi:very-short-patch-repair endonuclease